MALRIACAPPTHNPATARHPPSFQLLSVFRAADSSRPLTKGLSSFYLPLNWRTPVPSPSSQKSPTDRCSSTPHDPLYRGIVALPLDSQSPPAPGHQHPSRRPHGPSLHAPQAKGLPKTARSVVRRLPGPLLLPYLP